jgi:phosphoglycerate dehydrogenase-like enzyme/predicted dehydrogenase
MSSRNHVNKPLRVLVIGAGPATTLFHMPALARFRDSGHITLSVVCDIHRERAAAARNKFGFLEESGEASSALERPDIDAVYIFASAQLHHEYGMRALRAGKHLFVEKPIAPSYAEACEMAQLACAQGVVAAGGHNRRFYGSLTGARIRAGAARWRYAEAVFHKPEFGKPPIFGARSWLGANGIHALDAPLFVMGGLPDEITALADGTDRASAFSAIMRWRDGAQGVFLCNNSAGARREEYAFHGPGETLRVTETGLRIERNGTLSKIAFPAVGSGFAEEHEAFLEAIEFGEEPRHSIDQLAPSLYLTELIESGYSGHVQLPKPTVASPKRSSEPATKSILVVRPEGLEAALAPLVSQYNFVSLEDVDASVRLRPDIRAAIMGRSSSALPEDIVEKMPLLSVVGIAALSLSRHDPEALLARGVTLVNASAAYAESVAEFALALAILGRRRAFSSHTLMRQGGWGTGGELSGPGSSLIHAARGWRPALKRLGGEGLALAAWRKAKPLLQSAGAAAGGARDIKGATAGLVGWGANARAFAERLAAAGARVIVYSEHAGSGDIRAAGALPASLGEVLASDIVSLHRGLTPRTWHFLDAAELDKLRPGAVLINIARGALIEPEALVARLRRGDILACLDSYEEEPLPPSHPLRKLPNVFLTSHIAGGSRDMHAAAAEEVVQKVVAYLEGDAVEPISRERLRTMT